MPITREQFVQKVTELLTEYCDEAEHQDGNDVWEVFRDINDAVGDFTLYCQHVTKD